MFKVKICFFWLSIIAVCTANAVFAQHVQLVNLTKKTQEEGLSSYNVKKILQDKYGYLWIATQDGLNRYDGQFFKIYNTSTSKNPLINNDIWDMQEDTATSKLWVLSYYGLNAIDLLCGKVVDGIPVSRAKFPDYWLKCFKICGDELWIGTHNGLVVYNFHTRTFENIQNIPFNTNNKAPFFNISHIFIDEYKRAWVFVANYGLVVYSCKTKRVNFMYSLKQLNVEEGYDFAGFKCVTQTGPGSLFFSAGNRMKSATYNLQNIFITGKLLFGDGALANEQISVCTTDRFNNLWYANSSGLFRYSPTAHNITSFKDVSATNGSDWLQSIFCICPDNDNNIWIGTQKGIAIAATDNNPFSAYFQSSDFKEKIGHCYFCYPYNDSLILACASDGFYKVNTRTNIIERIDRSGAFFYLQKLPDGHLLVSSDDRLYIMENNFKLKIAESIYPELKIISHDPINSIVFFGDSLAIMGSDDFKGIFLWNMLRKKIEFVNEGTKRLRLASDIVNNLYKDSSDRIWVFSNENTTVLDLKKSTQHFFSMADQKDGTFTFFFDAAEAKGLYWLAVYGVGIVGIDKQFNIKKIISSKDGLCNTGVYKVFASKNNGLLVTTNNGLCKVDLEKNKIINYYKKDGLHSSSFEVCNGYNNGNFIFAGGEDGFTKINPSLLKSNESPPKLYVDHIIVEITDGRIDTANLSLKLLSIPNSFLQTTLYFTTLSYRNAERVTYEYKITGLDNTWLPLGTQNFVTLIGLPPGKYTLEVKAANEDGVWCAPKSLTLVFLPKWYQTLWFDFAIALATLSLMYGFYRYRIRQLKKQQQIRINIASDLHDDIGSALNTVKVFTHLAKRDVDKTEHINQIEETITQATTGLRDMIWILDDSQDTLQEILERIKKFALPVTMAHGIKLECINLADDNAQAVTKTKKRNLLLVAKECINNSIKYADCNNIQVVLNQKNNKVSLVIKDDGEGFNLATTPHGNGLANIHHRARQIHAVAEIVSVEGEGTTITITQK